MSAGVIFLPPTPATLQDRLKADLDNVWWGLAARHRPLPPEHVEKIPLGIRRALIERRTLMVLTEYSRVWNQRDGAGP